MLPTSKKDLSPRASRNNDFFSLQDQVNSIFQNFMDGWDLPMEKWAVQSEKLFRPSLDIKETDTAYEVKAELPDMGEKDVEITFQDNTLFMKGEKKSEMEEKDKEGNFYRRERTFGQFGRTIPFSHEVDAEKIVAHFKNGLMTVTLPKTHKGTMAKRRINIKT